MASRKKKSKSVRSVAPKPVPTVNKGGHPDRRTRELIGARRQRALAAWSQGKTICGIAREEGVDPGQISRDLDHVLAEAHVGRVTDNKAELFAMLGRLEWQKAELRAAWHRSKLPRERHKAKTKRGPNTKDKVGKETPGDIRTSETEVLTERIREGVDPNSARREGNPKIISEITRIERLEAELLGLLKRDALSVGVQVESASDADCHAIVTRIIARYGAPAISESGGGRAPPRRRQTITADGSLLGRPGADLGRGGDSAGPLADDIAPIDG